MKKLFFGQLIFEFRRLIKRTFISFGIALFFPVASLYASPQGGVIVHGQGSISQPTSTSTTINQNTQALAIDWNSFNVKRNERVTFVQPSSSSVALNRIINASPSEIMGQINANGRVILSNPSGILFGSNAQVNVAGLLATGLDIDPAEFMTGKFDLRSVNADGAGFVINQGLLSAATGGSINLVGGAVKNEGMIVADFGQINLLAGESAVVDFSGDGLLNFQLMDSVKQNITAADSAVKNSGTLQANGGKIVIEAKVAQDIFTQAVNNTGIIRATKIENIGGVVRLSGAGGHVRNSGEINAINGGEVVLTSTAKTEITGTGSVDVSNKSGIGGFFYMLGQKVGLFDEASVNASGKIGGGDVRIGGDVQGGGKLKKANYTVMSGSASIDASATENGDGGSVVLWAEKTAQVHGAITARGGALAGDGGFIETSGKEFLDVTSIPDAGAAVGESGEWLLDPVDIAIVLRNGGVGDGTNLDGLNPDYTPISGVDASEVYVDNLMSSLQSGTSVTVNTNATPGLGNGDIFIDTPIEMIPGVGGGSNVSLTLTADGNIEFRNLSSITATGFNPLDVVLVAGSNIDSVGAAATAVDTNGGDFSAMAAGFNVSKNILTRGGAITIDAPVIIDGAVNLSSNAIDGTAGNVWFKNTVDGNTSGVDELSVTAGAANVNFDAAVGATTSLNSLTIASAKNVNTVGITANALTQSAGTGLSAYGPLSINGNVDLTGTAFNLDTVNANALSISNSGTLALNQDVTLTGAFSQTGGGTTTLLASITSNGDIDLANDVTIDGDRRLDTSAVGDITLATVNADNSNGVDALTLIAGNRNINLNGSIGSVAQPLDRLSISSGNVVAANAITVNQLTQTSGSGIYNALSAAGDINLSGTSFTLDGLVTTSNGGALNIVNTGALEFNQAVTLDGAFNQSGGGAATLSGNISTSSDDITFTDAVTVDGAVSVSSNAVDDSAGNIWFKNTVDGNASGVNELSVTAGAANVNFDAAVGGGVGTSLNNLTIASANNVNTVGITANTLTQSTGTGLSTYGPLTISGDVNLSGTSFTLDGLVATSNGGALNIVNTGALEFNQAVTLDGALNQTGNGAVTLASGTNINTTGDNIFFTGPVTANGTVAMNTGVGAGAIQFIETVSGVAELNLTAGGGDVKLDKAVVLNTFMIASANNVNTDGITANALTQSAGTGLSTYGPLTISGDVDLSGTAFNLDTVNANALSILNSGALALNQDVTLTGAFNQDGNGSTVLSANITTAGNNISFADDVTIDGNRRLDTGAGLGNINFSESVNDINQTDSLNLVAGTGGISVNSIDVPSVTFGPASSVKLTGNIKTASIIQFNSPVIVNGSAAVDTSVGGVGSDIIFNSTVDGAWVNSDSLTLTAGINDVKFDQAVNLNNVTIVSAKNVTSKAINANALTQSTGTGLSTYGPLTISGDVNLSGTSFTLGGLVATSNGGALNIVNTGALEFNQAVTLDGAFNQSGGGAATLSGNISTSSDDITFTDAVTVNGAVSVSSNAVDDSAGNIWFKNTVDGNTSGVDELSVIAGAANVNFDAAVGAPTSLNSLTIVSANNVNTVGITANTLTQSAGTGLSTYGPLSINGNVDLTGTAFNLDTVNANAFTISNSGALALNQGVTLTGAFNQSGGGAATLSGNISTSSDDITFTDAVTVNGAVSVSSNAVDDSAGNIWFKNTVDGNTSGVDELSVIAGAANVNFDAAVGATTPLNSLTIASANNVTSKAINANALTQSTGTGLSTYGPLTINGDVDLSGTNFNLDTVSANVFNISNSSVLALNQTVTLDGALNQTGSGAVTLASGTNINTSGANIIFTGPVTANGTVAMDTGTAAGDIQFVETLSGTADLGLTAGSGDVKFEKAVDLNSLIVTSANNVSAADIKANTITQTAGAGISSFSALTAGAGGIRLSGSTINLNGLVTTSNAGDLQITNSNVLNIANGASIDVSASFIQDGAGVTQLGGNIKSAGNGISFAGNIVLTGDRVLRSTSTNGEIKLSGAVTGSHVFELSAGGDIYLASVDVNTLRLTNGKDLYLSSGITLQNSLSFSALDKILLKDNLLVSTGGLFSANNTSIDFSASNIISGKYSLGLNAGEVSLFQVGDGVSNLTGITVNANTLNLFNDVMVDGVVDFSMPDITLNSSLTLQAKGGTAEVKLGKVNGGNQSLDVVNDGITRLYGDITARNVNLSDALKKITLMNDLKIDTSEKNGDIDFSNTTINGPGKSLMLAAGNGRLYLNNVGEQASTISLLDIESAGDVTLSGGIFTENTLNFTALSDIMLDASSTGVALNSSVGDIALQNTSISGDARLSINSVIGDVSLSTIDGVAELTIAAGDDVEFDGDINADSVDLQNVNGDIFLSQSVVIDTSANNGDIQMQNSRVVGGANDLSLNAGTGKIVLGGAGNDTTRLNTLKIVNASALALYDNIFTKNGLDLSKAGQVLIQNNLELNTASGNGNILLGNTAIDGASDLLINAGGGLIQLASVGDADALSGLTLNTSGEVQLAGRYMVAGDVNAANISQLNLANDVLINTAAANGKVNFSGTTINGERQLDIDAGTGTVNVGSIGQTTALSQLSITATETNTGSIKTKSGQSYTGLVTLDGNLDVTESGGINIGQLNFQSDTTLSAVGNINIDGSLDGSLDRRAKLNLVATNGDITMNADAGANLVLDSLNASGKNIVVQSVFAANDVVLTAENTVTQNGDLTSTSGDVKLTATSGGILMSGSTLTTVSDDQAVFYTANKDIQIASIRGGDISLVSNTGEIVASVNNNVKNIVADDVSLNAARGVRAVNDAGNSDSVSILASSLSVVNAENDVLLATESIKLAPTRPEQNVLTINTLELGTGNLSIVHDGALVFNEQVDVAGNLNMTSRSQVTINKNFNVGDGIAIVVGAGSVDTAVDGFTLLGDMEARQGDISIKVNDLVQLFGEVTALNGDVSVTSDVNSIALKGINAGSNKATIDAAGGIKALDSTKANIIGGNVQVVSGKSGVGTFAKPLDISAMRTLINANSVFITGNFGAVFNAAGGYVDPGTAVSSANRGQSTSAQEFSFVDATVFSQELDLFDVINDGIRLPQDQLEDE